MVARSILMQDLALAAPRQKVLELALVECRAGLRQEVVGHGYTHRHRFQAVALRVDLANEQLPDRAQFPKNPRNRVGRLLDFLMAAGFAPDIDKNRTVDSTEV